MRAYYLLPLSLSLLCGPNDSGTATIQSADSALSRVGGRQLFHSTPFTGTLQTHDADGRVVDEVRYRDGVQHGRERHWLGDGQLLSDRNYRNGIKVGRHRSWWPNGQLCTDATFIAGVYDGPVRAFWSDGQPSEVRHFDRGREAGRQQSFAADGRRLANYVVRDGHRYGLLGAKLCFKVHGDPT